MINELSRENIKELNGKPVWACIWIIWACVSQTANSRYEKFSYQSYHLFMLEKVIKEIVEFCRYNSESQTVIQKITRIKSRSPQVAK